VLPNFTEVVLCCQATFYVKKIERLEDNQSPQKLSSY